MKIASRELQMSMAAQLLKDSMNLIFPPVCAVCRVRLDARSPQRLCPRCSGDIRYLQQPLCRVCGMEIAGDKKREYLCGECLRTPPAFCLARSLVRYEPAVQRLVQRLKYGSDTSVVAGIAEIIDSYDLHEFTDCHCVIPVPLHVARHRSRGLNQAAVLANLFFPAKIKSIQPDWLVRIRNTTAQTLLGGIERRKNLVGAFQVRPGSSVKRAVVCLVDDVFTTGTTAGECARVLLRSGAERVKVLTLARVTVPQRGGVR
jgi:ComF family protein